MNGHKTSMRVSHRRWAIRVVAPVAAALLLCATESHAHISLARSTPSKDAVVTLPLTELRLRFSGSVEPRYTSVRLFSPDGREIALAPFAAVPASGNREYVTSPLGGLPSGGRYVVEWKTAGADGHAISGSFGFTVAATADQSQHPDTAGLPQQHHVPPGGAAPDAESLVAVGIRWLNLTALVGLIGAVVFRTVVLARMGQLEAFPEVFADAATRTVRFARYAAILATIALFSRLWLQSAQLHGTANAMDPTRVVTMLSATRWGMAWIAQAVGTTFATLALLLVSWRLLVAPVALLAVVPALSGHAAATERFALLAITADALHVASASAWIGTLAALLWCGLPALRALSHVDRGAVLAALVRRFSNVAVGAVTLVIASGVISVLLHFTSIGDFLHTSYGRVLALKLGVLSIVLATGFYNWRYVQPSIASGNGIKRLRHSATAEVAVGIVVILVTAVLVALPTP